MRIAIVDDLAAERALLKDRLEQQLHRRNVQADILEYESGETFLEAARKAPFTAAFLDIYMDGMTGMEAAKKLRKTNTDCLLVFTTTSTDHALEGFQVRALHYLVKPFTRQRFQQALDAFCFHREAMAGGAVSQETLDSLLPPPRGDAVPPKGVQGSTLERVRACLRGAPPIGLSSETIARQTGLSAVTVRHYVNYLVEQGEAESTVNYDTGGRPSRLYRALG